MKKQYIVQKYVLAESVAEALKKSRYFPVHEVFLHSEWFNKNANSEFFYTPPTVSGFKQREE